MNNFAMFYVVNSVIMAFLLAVCIFALWALIRGAVLSALRKHAAEQREQRAQQPAPNNTAPPPNRS